MPAVRVPGVGQGMSHPCSSEKGCSVTAAQLAEQTNQRVHKCPNWHEHPTGQFHVGHTPRPRRGRRKRRPRGVL